MKVQSSRFLLAGAVAWVLFAGMTAVSAAGDQEIRVGKNGEIVFKTDVQAGDLTLPAGRYKVEHREEANEHYVRFIKNDVGPRIEADLKCRLEPMEKKATYTGVTIRKDGPNAQLTRIVVKGEDAIHFF